MLSSLETINPDSCEPNSFILDTCFLLYELEQGREKKLEEFCKTRSVYMTSFNLEELEHVERRIHHIKHSVSSFLKKKLIKRLTTEVHPGNYDDEKMYSNETELELLKNVRDPSDAVLVACAIRAKANILTRDKRHVFNSELENHLSKYNIKIFNSFPDNS